jgi:hypothetical protein
MLLLFMLRVGKDFNDMVENCAVRGRSDRVLPVVGLTLYDCCGVSPPRI